ncbi:MAG TPA: periplasmic heavy metal sensor [Catalimonadaceae bacterium]|jgi:Spy/CpxP family protein refolding chaperone|nr:periplasmic heavy metal sensor [Catalimonadaceae bacterium]
MMSNHNINQHPASKKLIASHFFPYLIFLALIVPTAKGFGQRQDSTKTNLRGISNLTAAQNSKIKELTLQLKKEILPLKNAIGEKMARLKTLETSEKTDISGIHSTIDEIQNLKSKMMKLKATYKQEIRKILTTEQRLEFDIRSNHKRKNDENRGHRGGHRKHGRD